MILFDILDNLPDLCDIWISGLSECGIDMDLDPGSRIWITIQFKVGACVISVTLSKYKCH
jgi:hypothetical protein